MQQVLPHMAMQIFLRHFQFVGNLKQEFGKMKIKLFKKKIEKKVDAVIEKLPEPLQPKVIDISADAVDEK